jgi:hypothetical protein
MDARCKSLDGNKYAQVFANKAYFSRVYPMDSKRKAGDALRLFCQEFGVPERLTFDGSKEQTCKGTMFMKQVRTHDIDHHIAEPDHHNQNPVEGCIRELRRRWYRIMIRQQVPEQFWDYGLRWVSETSSMTYTSAGKVVVRNKYRHDGACPFCLHPLEDTEHILDCQHIEALNSWNKSLWLFATSLHKAHFPVELIIAIKRELTAMRYRHVPPSLTTYPSPIRSMIRQQRLLGWNQFLLGFIPLTWKHHFLQILQDAKLLRHFSPDLWASKLIRASWDILHSVWIARNDKLFNTSRILDLSGQQILFRAIKKERAIGLSNLPACDFSRLLSIPLPTLLSKPLDFLKDWFVSVRSGQILYSDRFLLTDKFATDISLQRWVGLSPITDNDSDVEFSDHG